MTVQPHKSHVPVHARVNVTLRLPAEVVERYLKGTEYEGTILGVEPEFDREAIGELLDERVSEDFADLMDYAVHEPEAETDW